MESHKAGWAIAFGVDAITQERMPFALVYCTGKSDGQQGETWHDVKQKLVLHQWVRELEYFEEIYNRPFAQEIQTGYRTFPVVMISLMERYEFERILDLVPSTLYPKLKEIGARVSADTDQVREIERLRERVAEMSRSITGISKELALYKKYLEGEKTVNRELVDRCTDVEAKYAGELQATKLFEEEIEKLKKEPEELKSVLREMIKNKSLSRDPTYGRSYYIQEKAVSRLEGLLGCTV